MIQTKHYHLINKTVFSAMCYAHSNIVALSNLRSSYGHTNAVSIIKTYTELGLIVDGVLLVQYLFLSGHMYDAYYEVYPEMKYTLSEVDTIFSVFFKAIEWWNSNTGKYNQNLTERYYPNKKWSSLTEGKVLEIYLAENKQKNNTYLDQRDKMQGNRKYIDSGSDIFKGIKKNDLKISEENDNNKEYDDDDESEVDEIQEYIDDSGEDLNIHFYDTEELKNKFKNERLRLPEKSERTTKIAGMVSLLVTIFLFISLTSYLFTWQEDQDKVHQFGIKIFATDDIKVTNLLGVLGAYVAHTLIYKGFGLASYLLCTFFFALGVNLLFGKKIFNLFRNFKYVLVGLLLVSMGFAFASRGNDFSFGGALGELLNNLCVNLIGERFTILLVTIAMIIYFVSLYKLFKVSHKEKLQFDTPMENLEDKMQGNRKNILPVEDVLKKYGKKDLKISEENDNNKEYDDDDESEVDEIQEYIDDSGEDLNIHFYDEDTGEIINPEVCDRYIYPPIDLLEVDGNEDIIVDSKEVSVNKKIIIDTLKGFNIPIRKISVTVGPTVSLYELNPEHGVAVSSIKNRADDIAMRLSAVGFRMIVPIPGKGTIGIEIANAQTTLVTIGSLLASDEYQNNNFSLPIAIGKRIDNTPFIVDLTTMPHLLIAGATGQGKSICLHTILLSLLFKMEPSKLKLILIDPKEVELAPYKAIENLFLAKLPDEEDVIVSDSEKANRTLNSLCKEMDNRYAFLKKVDCNNISEYNSNLTKNELLNEEYEYLPFIVLVIDEFSDLTLTAGNVLEKPIIRSLTRLAGKGRAAGIHLIITTQRPTVKVITGDIKNNFPTRIAFKVSAKVDSDTILNSSNAQQLLGKGDMLIQYNSEETRLQCGFVSRDDVKKVCAFIGSQKCTNDDQFLLPE